MRDSNFFFSSLVRYSESELPDMPDSDEEDDFDAYPFDEDEDEQTEFGDGIFADLKESALKMLDFHHSDDSVYIVHLPHGLKLRIMLLRYPEDEAMNVQHDPQYIGDDFSDNGSLQEHDSDSDSVIDADM